MFPPDYLTSRNRFREATARLGWSLHAQPIPGAGPDGEELTIDAAISPNHAAERVLVVSSGLHGVEAPFGAAVQMAAMGDWANDIGPPAAFVASSSTRSTHMGSPGEGVSTPTTSIPIATSFYRTRSIPVALTDIEILMHY